MNDNKMSNRRHHLKLATKYYAKLGWKVFPIHHITEAGECSCGKPDCSSPGKHPMLSNGFKEATDDLERIEWWWNKWPDANVGIRTGEASNLAVIDCDPRNGSDYSFEQIEDCIPDTVHQFTGGDGDHYFFTMPEGVTLGSRANVLPGIDIKAEGGYILAPPSNHKSGGEYDFEGSSEPKADFMPAPFPVDLIKRLELTSSTGANEVLPSSDDNYPLPAHERERIESALGSIPPDDRDEWLYIGMAIHDFHSGQEGFELWDAWAQRTQSGNYLRSSQAATWRSFKNKKNRKTIDHLWHRAGEHGWIYKPAEVTKFIFDQSVDYQDVPVEERINPKGYSSMKRLGDWGGVISMGELMRNPEPPREHFWRGATLRAKSKNIIVGMPKAKKTWFTLGLCLAAATGRHFGGTTDEYKFPRPIKTLWLQGEMYADDIAGRLQMLTENMESHEKALVDNNFRLSMPRSWNIQDINQFIALEQILIDHQPEIVFFDPFSTMHGVNENDNGEMLDVLDRFDCLMERYGCAVVLVHHTGKGAKSRIRESNENPFDVMRGASSLLGWLESGILLGPGDDKDSVKLVYEHRAQRVPDPHHMTLVFDQEAGSATWEMKIETLADGNYSAIPDIEKEFDVMRQERVKAIVDRLRLEGAMTSGVIISTIETVFKIKSTAAKEVLQDLKNHPFIEVKREGRQTLFWHVMHPDFEADFDQDLEDE